MAPHTKMTTKWVLTVAGACLAILSTVIASTVNITTKFNQNDSDHIVIVSKVDAEIKRSTEIDNKRDITAEKMNDKLDEVKSKQIEVVTNQKTILQAIEAIRK